ncbi:MULTISPECIES: glycoside hydrolase family 6 protein [unclassified Crossiella]|uniref:glycoside hydrolase family 6 protein n=1 Tax=unclassified Crossiella TaxID=2620835 RepID=UPI001FFEA790|nr:MULTISPECIES: glycoside hydrolase family 6 protein [unclassified Crossiella]MCK2240816.1 glycoside hydrolase family 6 protein [Crossiella sp. S99.2]MCK2254040.1 glycoside hydrolase family 6 protein [Crossiella sp. S99.1]
MGSNTARRRGLAATGITLLLAVAACSTPEPAAAPASSAEPPALAESTSVPELPSGSIPAPAPSGNPPTSKPGNQPRPPAGPAAPSPIAETRGLFVDSESNAARWVRANKGDGRAHLINERIAAQPMARWIGGEGDIRSWLGSYVQAAAREDQLPVVVPYNIPNRDCGNHSAGGAGSVDKYRQWVETVADAIGKTPALVVLEPDALIHLSCLDPTGKQDRLRMLAEAVATLSQRAPNAWTYLDGGDGRYNPPGTLAQRLIDAGVSGARGFAVNVSNFNTTNEAISYGRLVQAAIAARGGGKHGFVIDVSRNGNGSNGEWCNPPGRKIGQSPSVDGSSPQVPDALLWIKQPGASDGDCGTGKGTDSGAFVPELAMSLLNGL